MEGARTPVDVCAGCLDSAKALRAVAGSLHEEYFATVLFQLCGPLQLQALQMCWQCAAVLRSITRFREQVETSCRTLADYLVKGTFVPEEISKPPKLKVISLESTSYTEIPQESNIKVEHYEVEIKSDCDVKTDYFDDAEDIEDINRETVMSTEVKEEPEDREDKKKLKKHKKKKRKEQKDDVNSTEKTKLGKERIRRNVILDPEKIKKIVLSPKELREERANDAQSEAYLKLPYRCESCIQGFDHIETLNDHMDRKHNLALGKFECGTCKSVLGSQASYSTHCRRHLLRFECAACGKRSIDKGAMLKHYGAEHDSLSATRYTCGHCGYVSESYRSHRYHKEKHKEKPQCEDCGKTFINKNSLRCHMLNIHRDGGRAFSCDSCGKTYRGKSGLFMHMWTHDARARAQAYCAQCRVHFNTLYNYQNHLRNSRNHRTECTLVPCEERACDKRFPTQRQMKQHFAFVHLNSTENQCRLCSKTFKHRVGLERHRKYVHEKLRPPRDKMCHHCGRGFTTASILRSHIRTHTGERPLACSSCVATFSHSSALYTHKKLVHGAH